MYSWGKTGIGIGKDQEGSIASINVRRGTVRNRIYECQGENGGGGRVELQRAKAQLCY